MYALILFLNVFVHWKESVNLIRPNVTIVVDVPCIHAFDKEGQMALSLPSRSRGIIGFRNGGNSHELDRGSRRAWHETDDPMKTVTLRR